MTGILLTCLLLILLIAALYLVVARPGLVAGWVWRLCRNTDPWSRRARLAARLLTAVKEPAPDPVDEHFMTAGGAPVVRSDHPADCAEACCWEIRLTELVSEYDWHAAEYEMRKTK